MRDLPNEGRLLGLDVGGKRIGVAISDEGQILSSPWGMVEQGRASIGEIGRIARETGAIAIVAGLPTGMSGREGAQAAETRRFADAVERGAGIAAVLLGRTADLDSGGADVDRRWNAPQRSSWADRRAGGQPDAAELSRFPHAPPPAE